MKKYFYLILLALFGIILVLNGCGKKDDSGLKNSSRVRFVPVKKQIIYLSKTPIVPIVTPAVTPSAAVPSPSVNPNNPLSEMEADTLSLINGERGKNGLAPLMSDERIAKEARKHSVEMADGSVAFGHDGFNERIQATGINYSFAGENVAWNNYTDPANQAVIGWMNSPGHRQNILGDFNLTGMGIAKSASGRYYFTQIFMKAQLPK